MRAASGLRAVRRADPGRDLRPPRRPGDDRSGRAAPAAGSSPCRATTRDRRASRTAIGRLHALGAYDAVLIADGGRTAAAAAPLLKTGASAGGAAARHRIVGDRDRPRPHAGAARRLVCERRRHHVQPAAHPLPRPLRRQSLPARQPRLRCGAARRADRQELAPRPALPRARAARPGRLRRRRRRRSASPRAASPNARWKCARSPPPARSSSRRRRGASTRAAISARMASRSRRPAGVHDQPVPPSRSSSPDASSRRRRRSRAQRPATFVELDALAQPQPHQQRLRRPLARRRAASPRRGRGRCARAPPASSPACGAAASPRRRAGRARRGRCRDRAGSASKRGCGGSPRRAGHGWRSRRRAGRPPPVMLLGQLVEDRRLVRIARRQLAARGHRGEARAGLDRQLVEREMAGAEAERPLELGRPGRLALAGQRVDQVEADPVEAALRGRQRGERLRRRHARGRGSAAPRRRATGGRATPG